MLDRPRRLHLNSWDKLGIEVELENVLGMHCDADRMHGDFSPWFVKGDGSLRGGSSYEFVLKQPTIYSEVEAAVKMFGEYEPVMDAAATRRCSTHIHVDCRGMTSAGKVRRIVGSLLLEPILYAMVDPARASSVFCRPSWCQGRTTYREAGRLAANNIGLDDFAERSNKYTGINFHALNPYGSIEFRMAPGIKDPDLLLLWIDVILSVMRFADNNSTNQERLMDVSYNYSNIVKEHLGWALPLFAVSEEEIRRASERVSYAVKNICMEY